MTGVTQEDVSRLTRAMKTKEFQGHMDEYCREISDPAHRGEYLQYLDQLEARKEMPEGQQLLRCEPGLCVKTWIVFKNGQKQKCFINICHSDQLEDCSTRPAEGGDGQQVHLPYSLSPPRPDRDHKDEYCMTCDFGVSTRTFLQARNHPQYLKMLVDTAADGLFTHHLKGAEEVKKDWKEMKRMRCKGNYPMPMSVRTEMLKDNGKKTTSKSQAKLADAVTPSELRKMRQEAKDRLKGEQAEGETDEVEPELPAPKPAQAESGRIRVPQHKLVHSGVIDLANFMQGQQVATDSALPKLLKLIVELPTVKRVGDINLEVTTLNVVVEVPQKYYLDLPLPYEIQEEQGSAKFDKAKHILTLELPLVVKMQTRNPHFTAPRSGDSVGDDSALSEHRASSEEDLPPLSDCGDVVAESSASRDDSLMPPETGSGQPQEIFTVDTPSLETEDPVNEAIPSRELLDVEPHNNLLNIAGSRHASDEGNGDPGPVVPSESSSLPRFVASEHFDGERPGYYFGMGDQGLGYYLDRRQSRAGVASSGTAQAAAADESQPSGMSSQVPLVEEKAATEIVPTSVQDMAVLPSSVQRYLDAADCLFKRITDVIADTDLALADIPIRPEQNRQNLFFIVDVPSGSELADVRLQVRSQVLALSFCTRSPNSGWRRHSFRRILCGLVDPRQWHCELVGRSKAQLIVVLRKADRLGLWPQIFDTASALPSPLDDAGLEDTVQSAAKVHSQKDVSLDTSSSAAVGPDVAPSSFLDDSTELDVAVQPNVDANNSSSDPVTGPGSTLAKAPATRAPDAMVQSAIVMGQGVLLKNRLIYQLL